MRSGYISRLVTWLGIHGAFDYITSLLIDSNRAATASEKVCVRDIVLHVLKDWSEEGFGNLSGKNSLLVMRLLFLTLIMPITQTLTCEFLTVQGCCTKPHAR